MLVEGALPSYGTGERYGNRDQYAAMLREVFTAAKQLLHDNAVILVRTDSRPFTLEATKAVLDEQWPGHHSFTRSERPVRSQTRLFGSTDTKPGETDLLLLPPGAA